MADIITQAELRGVWNTWNNFGNTILNIRKRSESGVPFEPGFIKAESDGPLAPIEDQLHDGLVMEPTGFDMFGLDITLSDEAAEPAENLKSAQPETSEPALPEWLTVTPHECEYFLAMAEGGLDCQECQNIDLTRKEFLLLKLFLAKLRSMPIPLEQPEWVKVGGTEDSIWTELTPEEIGAVPEAAHAL